MADPDSTSQIAPRLRVVVTDGRGRSVRAAGLAAWLAGIAPRAARGEVAVALVSDTRIRALNKQFRRKDTPTDVLSFAPFGASRGPQALSAGVPKFLGDIVISTATARRQAREAKHSYASELKVLALHGLLHLLGYDHEHQADRGRMARLERRLRAQGGLRAGLIERAPAARARRRRGPRREALGPGPRRSRGAERARAGGGAPASTEK